MANIIVFAILAVVIIAAALAAVFTKRIMRSVTSNKLTSSTFLTGTGGLIL